MSRDPRIVKPLRRKCEPPRTSNHLNLLVRSPVCVLDLLHWRFLFDLTGGELFLQEIRELS